MIIETFDDYANVIAEPDDIHPNSFVITREEKGDFFSPLTTQRLYVCNNVQSVVRLLATLASYRFREISKDSTEQDHNSDDSLESPIHLLRLFAAKANEIEKKNNNFLTNSQFI